jgi:hypothetical protein
MKATTRDGVVLGTHIGFGNAYLCPSDAECFPVVMKRALYDKRSGVNFGYRATVKHRRGRLASVHLRIAGRLRFVCRRNANAGCHYPSALAGVYPMVTRELSPTVSHSGYQLDLSRQHTRIGHFIASIRVSLTHW